MIKAGATSTEFNPVGLGCKDRPGCLGHDASLLDFNDELSKVFSTEKSQQPTCMKNERIAHNF